MYKVPPTDDDDDSAFFAEPEPEPEPEPKPKRAPKSVQAPGKKPKSELDAPLGQAALQRGLYSIFKVLTILLRSDAEFEEQEFSEAAHDLIDLVNRLAPLRFFFNVLAPLGGLVTLKDKIQRLLAQRKSKPAKAEPMYPSGVQQP